MIREKLLIFMPQESYIKTNYQAEISFLKTAVIPLADE